jgi:hypothetical protein
MLFVSFLSKTADSETNWRQGGSVDSAGIRHLKQQRFVGLFETRPLKNENAIGALSRADPPRRHTESFHRQLL